LKKLIQKWIDENLDHKMILHEADPLLGILTGNSEPVFVMDDNPTAENIAKVIYYAAKEQGLPVTEIRFWETESSFATYRQPSEQKSDE